MLRRGRKRARRSSARQSRQRGAVKVSQASLCQCKTETPPHANLRVISPPFASFHSSLPPALTLSTASLFCSSSFLHLLPQALALPFIVFLFTSLPFYVSFNYLFYTFYFVVVLLTSSLLPSFCSASSIPFYFYFFSFFSLNFLSTSSLCLSFLPPFLSSFFPFLPFSFLFHFLSPFFFNLFPLFSPSLPPFNT